MKRNKCDREVEKNEAMKRKNGESKAPIEPHLQRTKKKKNQGIKKNKCEGEMEKKQKKSSLITDDRFASAQSDPRFRKMPKREAKVPVDSRFSRMLSDRSFSSSSAPVDKRGKARKGEAVNPLLHYYLHEKEPGVDGVVDGDTGSDSSDGGTDESSSTTDDDEDDDDDNSVNSDICRYLMANHEDTPTTERETHRLAIVNMDWEHIKSVDIYVVMSSCLPKGGQILSVTIYPSEFGLKCMQVETLHGPSSLIDADGEESEDEPDPEVINEKLRGYELNKLRYYYAVAVFDSSTTANHVYNTLDGTELTRTSNVFDLRFVPDSMEFKHPSRDLTNAAPTNYKQPDFQTFALQHNKVKLTWEDDEPQRVRTLRRKFNAEELDDLNEYLASSDDSDDEHVDSEKLRSLLDHDNNSGTDQSENDMDMEITFNTGLEDLSKRIIEKKDKKSETVWEQVLRKQKEKRNARKNWSKELSDDEDSDYDVKELPEQSDDFFIEENSDTDLKPVKKRNKVSKDRNEHNKLKKQSQEVDKEQEASRAELELLFADDQEVGKGPKGYKINAKKIKGHKGKEINEEKVTNVDYSNDSRFLALFSDHNYALDPTDPHYKRSAVFARQQIQKQAGSKATNREDASFEMPDSSSSSDESDIVKKKLASSSGKEKHELSSLVRSLKRNIEKMKK